MHRVMIPEHLVDHGFDSMHDPIMYPNHDLTQWLNGNCMEWHVELDREQPFRLVIVFMNNQTAMLFKLTWL